MKTITIIILLLSVFLPSSGQEIKMKSENAKLVLDFIGCIKLYNKEKLSGIIDFPFDREYPLPSIKNKQEFIQRYAEVFDDSLSQLIVNSNLNQDWAEVGWRGIMFMRGQVWLGYDGRLLAVNYQSAAEKNKLADLVQAEKLLLHSSLNKFEKPICILETSKNRIRIDDLGNANYRYTSWKIQEKMSAQPEIIIEHGEFISEGTGGNHKFEFRNGNYIYDCEIIVMDEPDSPPAYLTILKNNKEVLSEPAQIIKH